MLRVWVACKVVEPQSGGVELAWPGVEPLADSRRAPVWWIGHDLAADPQRMPASSGARRSAWAGPREPRSYSWTGVALPRIGSTIGHAAWIAPGWRRGRSPRSADAGRAACCARPAAWRWARRPGLRARLHLEADHDLGLDLEAQPVAVRMLRGKQLFGRALPQFAESCAENRVWCSRPSVLARPSILGVCF